MIGIVYDNVDSKPEHFLPGLVWFMGNEPTYQTYSLLPVQVGVNVIFHVIFLVSVP